MGFLINSSVAQGLEVANPEAVDTRHLVIATSARIHCQRADARRFSPYRVRQQSVGAVQCVATPAVTQLQILSRRTKPSFELTSAQNSRKICIIRYCY